MLLMISVDIFEAQSVLCQLVQYAAEGEEVVLTREGKPVAEMRAPAGWLADVDASAAIAALRETCRTLHVGSLDVAELRREGRR